MMPALIRFTGTDIEPHNVINRRHFGPIPLDWTRHHFKSDSYVDAEWPLNEWLAANIFGRWACNYQNVGDGTVFVLAFENPTDAVMFRLNEGETAWRNDQIS